MSSNKLNFYMQTQQKTHWCWAANAASIAEFYNSSMKYTQCAIASACLKHNNCCSNNLDDICNIPGRLDSALLINDNLAQFVDTPINADEICSEIDSGRVIGVRIQWSSKFAHFVSLIGYTKLNRITYVTVADPDGSELIISLSQLRSRYKHIGKWTHSYFTKSNSATMLNSSSISTSIINKALKLREEFIKLNTSQSTKLFAPHEVYIISYSELLAGHTKTSKVGFRVVDITEKGNELIYEFSSMKVNAKLLGIIDNKTFSNTYEDIINNYIKQFSNIDNFNVLRLVQQPELNIEAFWLHNKLLPKNDKFISVSNQESILYGHAYSRDVFHSKLYAIASKRDPYVDMLMGG